MSGILMEVVGVSDRVLLNSSPKECLDRSAEVESQHPGTQGSHTSGISSSGCIFLLFLVRPGIEAISKAWK